NAACTLTNLRAGYQREQGAWQWAVFGGANNVLDERYNANVRINAAAGRYFEPGPWAHYYAGASLRYRFGQSRATAAPSQYSEFSSRPAYPLRMTSHEPLSGNTN